MALRHGNPVGLRFRQWPDMAGMDEAAFGREEAAVERAGELRMGRIERADGGLDVGPGEKRRRAGDAIVRLHRVAQRVHRDIADIMVMPAIAPGPAAARVENVEGLAVQQLAHCRCRGIRPGAQHGRRRNAGARHGRGIMGGEAEAGERDIGEIRADRMDARIIRA